MLPASLVINFKNLLNSCDYIVIRVPRLNIQLSDSKSAPAAELALVQKKLAQVGFKKLGSFPNLTHLG